MNRLASTKSRPWRLASCSASSRMRLAAEMRTSTALAVETAGSIAETISQVNEISHAIAGAVE